jgi:hypothetical protein
MATADPVPEEETPDPPPVEDDEFARPKPRAPAPQ